MKNMTREDLLELYEDAYWQAKQRPPPPLDDVDTEQLAADFLSLV
jgi:lysozyme family protein